MMSLNKNPGNLHVRNIIAECALYTLHIRLSCWFLGLLCAAIASYFFALQVEVFHLKQRLQSMENRAPTPRKPFQV